MKDWPRWGLAGLMTITALAAGCVHAPQPANVNELEALKRENAALIAEKTALESHEEELRWLHIYLEKHVEVDPPRSAVEEYLNAIVHRNGAAARLFLSKEMQTKLDMPTHGIGTSDWPYRRYEIVGEKRVGADTYEFQAKLCGEEATCAGGAQKFTVQSQPGEAGADVWIITAVQ